MVPQNIKNCTALLEFKRLIKVWKPDTCPCIMYKKCCKYWFHLIKHTPFISPKQKDQTFMLMDMSIIIAFLIYTSFITKRMKVDLCLDTHSTGEINLVDNYIATLNEGK